MKTNKLSEKAFIYDLTDENMRKELKRARGLVQKLNSVDVNDDKAKRAIMEELFGAIGEGSDLNPNFYCDFGSHIFIGKTFSAITTAPYLTLRKFISAITAFLRPTFLFIRQDTPLNCKAGLTI